LRDLIPFVIIATPSINWGDEKIRYRLWKDQDQRCAYSGNPIALGQIFSADCEIDHILPFKKSLDDSYMNKVLCFLGLSISDNEFSHHVMDISCPFLV
jgi:CRISPR/Cas system Type II protein with McrA/HNH and RuvC-like nuclease domain